MPTADGLPPDAFRRAHITQKDIQWAVRIGLVELDGKELSISNEAFIDLGAPVARMGIPVSEILDEHEALTISVKGIAERFREVFQRHFWEPFVREGMPAEELPSLTAAVSQLTELTSSIPSARPARPSLLIVRIVRYNVGADPTTPKRPGSARRNSISVHASPPPANIPIACTNTVPRSWTTPAPDGSNTSDNVFPTPRRSANPPNRCNPT